MGPVAPRAADVRKCPKMSDLAKCNFARAAVSAGPAKGYAAIRAGRSATVGHLGSGWRNVAERREMSRFDAMPMNVRNKPKTAQTARLVSAGA